MLWSSHIKEVFQDTTVLLSKIWGCDCGWRNFPTSTFKTTQITWKVAHGFSSERCKTIWGKFRTRFFETLSILKNHHVQKTCDISVTLIPEMWAIGCNLIPQAASPHPRLSKVTCIFHCFLWVCSLWTVSVAPLSLFHQFSPHASTSPFDISFFPENSILIHCTLLPVIHLLPLKNQDLSCFFYYLAYHMEGKWHKDALVHAEWGV